MRPSRAMIPGEILCACFALTLAWAGGIGWWITEPGPLYWLLRKGGQNMAWLLLLGVPAVFLIFWSAREWLYGHMWSSHTLSKSCSWRCKAVALMGLSWLYGVYLLNQLTTGAGTLSVQATFAAMYCGWSYLENRRVRREIRKKYCTA